MIRKNKIKVIITGSNGQIGKAVTGHFSADPDFECFAFDSCQADLLNTKLIQELIQDIKPGYLINSAAYTGVDKAESEHELCFNINAKAVGIIAESLNKVNGKLVQFSSDYVYHSYDGFPLKEDSITNPQGVYARSKLEGEKNIRSYSTPALILRTSWVCSPHGKNFINTILQLCESRSEIRVVNDQYGAPAFASDIAAEVYRIIRNNTTGIISDELFNDTYNYCSEGLITWYDFAKQICKSEQTIVDIIPIPSSGYPTPASRPAWSVMSMRKIKTKLGAEPSHWLESLKRCLQDRKNT